MGDFFANLRSGVQFPQVVMNQGPLPGSGGLPRPLHDTADGRINYNSTLLGNLSPYAYGEPGYLSSQTAYLNIPHKLQKFVPVVYLPEAKKGATEFFDLSHAVDDGDLVFTLRLARNSLFCTGLRHGDTRRSGLGTRVDPLINLATVNYILSGMQLGVTPNNAAGDLWSELLFNLDPSRFGKRVGLAGRHYGTEPLILSDIVHIVRHCIRPIGIARGSENQGGQNEVSMGAATWPVGFVVSVTLDGKESNVLNLWHHTDLSAGDDLVLALKLMPVRPYTLNHYFEGFKRQNWSLGVDGIKQAYVWQLVPTLAHLEPPTKEDETLMKGRLESIDKNMRMLGPFRGRTRPSVSGLCSEVNEKTPWQELGYWHIGRTQLMTARYGVEEYWHNDQANSLRTNHLDITLQPFFALPPKARRRGNVSGMAGTRGLLGAEEEEEEDVFQRKPARPSWEPSLGLEFLSGERSYRDERPSSSSLGADVDREASGGWAAGMLGLASGQSEFGASGRGSSLGLAADEDIGTLQDAGELLTQAAAPVVNVEQPPLPLESSSEALSPPIDPPVISSGRGGRSGGGKRQATGAGVRSVVGGSLLRADGTSESCMVSMV